MRGPEIHLLGEPRTEGLPLSAERFEPVGLSDPQAMLDLLDAQSWARRILPCVSSTSRHWRYFLFAVPREGRGRPIAVARRLVSVLESNTARGSPGGELQERSGICRREWLGLTRDGRRKLGPLFAKCEERFSAYYGSAAKAFWEGVDEEGSSHGAASEALRARARAYILGGDYSEFFQHSGRSDGLRSVFHARLRSFRPGLADLLEARDYDVRRAARSAAYWKGLEEEDRLLFLAWSLLQAYFGIIDDGLEPEDSGASAGEDSDGAGDGSDGEDDGYLRDMARAALALLRVVKKPGDLNQKQLATVSHQLSDRLKANSDYRPPELVHPTKADGRRRRIFPGLRLWAYAYLLETTSVHGP